MTTINYAVNDYGIEMLEIKTGKFPIFVSLKKAIAVLDTQHDVSLIKTEEKYGKELYRITYKDTNKSFMVGINKINAILDNEALILEALNANIDVTKQA